MKSILSIVALLILLVSFKSETVNDWNEIIEGCSKLTINDQEFVHLVKEGEYNNILILDIESDSDLIMVEFKLNDGSTVNKKFIDRGFSEYIAVDKPNKFKFITRAIEVKTHSIN